MLPYQDRFVMSSMHNYEMSHLERVHCNADASPWKGHKQEDGRELSSFEAGRVRAKQCMH